MKFSCQKKTPHITLLSIHSLNTRFVSRLFSLNIGGLALNKPWKTSLHRPKGWWLSVLNLPVLDTWTKWRKQITISRMLCFHVTSLSFRIYITTLHFEFIGVGHFKERIHHVLNLFSAYLVSNPDLPRPSGCPR